MLGNLQHLLFWQMLLVPWDKCFWKSTRQRYKSTRLGRADEWKFFAVQSVLECCGGSWKRPTGSPYLNTVLSLTNTFVIRWFSWVLGSQTWGIKTETWQLSMSFFFIVQVGAPGSRGPNGDSVSCWYGFPKDFFLLLINTRFFWS